ncbi:MAG: hypothetical protein OXG69_03480, partial [bacterium]|nr:hypothetical protein [bacterium]
IAILLGGRIAEELTNGNITTGAGNDLDRATDMARRMVCEWGMSEAIGPLTYGKKEEQVFLGRDFAQSQDYSEGTAIHIDEEIKRIVTENYDRARDLLDSHKDELLRIAEELLIREVLDADQVTRLAKGLPIEDPMPDPASGSTPPAGCPRSRSWVCPTPPAARRATGSAPPCCRVASSGPTGVSP